MPGDLGHNVISGNFDSGIALSVAGNSNVVRNNDIGINVQGLGPLLGNPMQNTGILIDNTPGTVVGADSFDNGGNVISGNTIDGIFLTGLATVGTQITNNEIGTDKTATNPLGNGLAGVDIASEADSPATQTLVSGNVIAGNLQAGLVIDGSSLNSIVDNYIGTNVAESKAIPNSGSGILLENSSNNTIGGATSIASNVIAFTQTASGLKPSLGGGHGIDITGTGSKANHIEANAVSDNAGDGIRIGEGASGNLIGEQQGNVSVRNGAGIDIDGVGTSNNLVQGNRIGVGSDGLPAGNVIGVDVEDSASNNIIGDGSFVTSLVAGNVISANTRFGVVIESQANNNTVAGNLIGTNLSGSIAAGFGNQYAGVDIISAPNNIIGGAIDVPGVAPGNKIEGNGVGVVITQAGSTGNDVEGNVISGSIGSNGAGAGSNPPIGVYIEVGASNNTIGGAEATDGNTITANSGDSVFVESGQGNEILQNLIFSNTGLGIDLALASSGSSGANNGQKRSDLELCDHRVG